MSLRETLKEMGVGDDVIVKLPSDEELREIVRRNEDHRLRSLIVHAFAEGNFEELVRSVAPEVEICDTPRTSTDVWLQIRETKAPTLRLPLDLRESPYNQLVTDAMKQEAKRILAEIGPDIAAGIRRDLLAAAKLFAPEEPIVLTERDIESLGDERKSSELARISVYDTPVE